MNMQNMEIWRALRDYWTSLEVARWVESRFFLRRHHQIKSYGQASAGYPIALNTNGEIDTSFMPDALLRDGSRTLTANWDIGDNQRVLADGVRARDGAGLRLEDDAGNLGVFVEDGGDVGIGTATPTVKLDVAGAITASGVITGDGSGLTTLNASNISSGTLADARFTNALLRDGSRTLTADWDIGDNQRVLADGVRARDGAGLRLEDDAGNLGVFVEDGGEVGIGNSAPSSLLTVGSVGDNSTSNAIALVGGNLGNNEIKFFGGGNTTTKEVAAIRATAGGSYAESGVLIFRTASNDGSNNLTLAEQMRITDTGLVGIGNSAPSSLLTVGSVGSLSTSNAIALVGGNTGNNEIKFFGGGNTTTKEVAAIRATAGGSYAESGVLIFRTASNDGSNNLTLAERMRITDTGLVGIGTTSPQGALHVKDGDGYYLVKYVSPINSATPIVVIPNGAGDVTKIIQFEFVVTDGTNSTASSGSRTPGGAVVDATLGTNTFRMTVNADGSVDVRRQAGTGTLSAMFEFKWI